MRNYCRHKILPNLVRSATVGIQVGRRIAGARPRISGEASLIVLIRRSPLRNDTERVGSPIGLTLTLPPEITLTESIRVQCKGRVVRVEDTRDDGKVTVAAVIEEYEFLPEA